MSSEPSLDDLLPLQPATFHILMALSDEDRHGYAIIQEIAARTDGAIRLSAGTLYRSLQRMLEQGADRGDRGPPRAGARTTSAGATTASRSSARRSRAPRRGACRISYGWLARSGFVPRSAS